MTNIEIFDEYAAELLAMLYEHFPLAITFDTHPAEIAGLHWDVPPEERLVENAARKAIARRAEIQSATATWLNETGYFSAMKVVSSSQDIGIKFVLEGNQFDAVDQVTAVYTAYQDARLTPKGLEALRATPRSLSGVADSKSLGEQLVDETKQIGTDAKKQAISKIIGEVIGTAFKAIAN